MRSLEDNENDARTYVFLQMCIQHLPSDSCLGSSVRLSVEIVLPLESALVTGHHLCVLF